MVAAALAAQHPRLELARHEKAAGERIDRGVAWERASQAWIVAYFCCCWPGLSSLSWCHSGSAGEPASGLDSESQPLMAPLPVK
jgi:hypothetical protein